MEMLRIWRRRLQSLFRRRQNAELEEELAFHLEHQVQENITRGMKPDEAYRQARIEFGAVEKTKEACREERPGFLMEGILQEVRYAVRGFRRNPLFTLTILVTLMLGIGATTAVFSVVDRVLFRSLPYAYADRIVSVGMVHSLETQAFLMGNFYYDWRDNQSPFDVMTSESTGAHECDLTERNPSQLSCDSVEGSFLPTLGVTPVVGRNFLPEEACPGGPQVALISYRLWSTHYSHDPEILNKTIAIDGSPVRVVGVLPEEFEMPRLEVADVLRPLTIDQAADHKANGGFGTPRRAFARLKSGVTVEQAKAAMDPLFQNAMRQVPLSFRKDFHLSVRSLRDVQMQNVRLMAWLLLCSVIAVLLIACANVASLLMARGAMRQRELAVRAALGASRARLARHALTEAMLLSLMGAVAGCVFAAALLRMFVAVAPQGIPFIGKARLDLRVIGFTVVVSLLCAMLSGLASALQRPKAELLVGRVTKSVSRAAMRQWLVAGQIAASMILLTVAMLLTRSFRNLENQQMGMRVDNTVTASVTLGQHDYPTLESQAHFFEELGTRLRYGPGVSEVAVTDSLPPAAGHDGRRLDEIVVAGRAPAAKGSGGVVASRWISSGYFRVLNIPIVQGRDFSEEDVASSERPVILSRTLAARLFPGRAALGERLQFDNPLSDAPWYTVVGVAADVKNSGLVGEDVPEYYRLRRSRSDTWDGIGTWSRTGIFVVRSSMPVEATTQWIRSQTAALAPALPVNVATMKQRVSSLADQPRFQTVLVGFFALTGLAMAVIGLYGVISFLVTQRTQDIGVRMALGASRVDILRLVLGRSIRLLLCGILAGLVASLAVSRTLSHLLYSIGPYDLFSYGVVVVLLVCVGVIATLIPARSAVRVDPAIALRSE
jgi:predicted permease